MKILLCCAAGMSTSLLVTKMKKEAEAKGLDIDIQAVSQQEVSNHLEDTDVLLLGPQIRYKLSSLKKLTEGTGIPVEVINPVDYGTVNGQKVLEHAINLSKREQR